MKTTLKKTRMKTCCVFFSLKTGTVILGCLGIILFVLALVPHSIILQNHDFYMKHFVIQQRAEEENDIRDSEIPDIQQFSKIASAVLVAYDTVFIFSSIFLIAGVSAEKRFLLVPWLVNLMLTILLVIVLLLAVIFSDQFKFSVNGQFNPNAVLSIILVVLPLLLSVYLWFVVYTTFLQLHEKDAQKENQRTKGNSDRGKSGTWQPLISSHSDNNAGDQTGTTSIENTGDTGTRNNSLLDDGNEAISTGRTSSTITMCEQGHLQHRSSLSNSSFSSIKGSLRVVIGGTPPPPYEAVASDIDKEEKAMKAGIHRSELIYAAVPMEGESKHSNDMWNLELKRPSNKVQTGKFKPREEGKLTVDDNYIQVGNLRKGSSENITTVASRNLLGKSLEDITCLAAKTIKSTSYCQLPSSSMAASSSPRAVQKATIAVFNEKPSLDISDLGFPSALKNKENNNYEVAC